MTWRTDKLADLTDTKNAWKQIRFEKQAFTPRFYGLEDIRGNRVPISKKRMPWQSICLKSNGDL